MASNLRLDPELTGLVERARRQAAASGELSSPPQHIDALPPEAQDALRDWVDSGDFAAAVAAIGAEDPDLATE